MPAAPPSETDFEGLLRALVAAGVEFVVIGGVAAKAHGAARLTVDLDVVYARSAENLLRVTAEVAGGGTYEALVPHSRELDMFGLRCRCLDLDKLIQVKRAAGRPKDLEAIAELEAIREERRKRGL